MSKFVFNRKNLNGKFEFSIDVVPPDFKEIIILKGSFYEMGEQYGKAAKELIKRNACSVYCEAMDFNNIEEIADKLKLYMEYVEEKTPDIFDFWKGIADGAGIEIEKIGLINYEIPLVCESSLCSGIGAWGKATADNNLVIASNVDSMVFCNLYGVTLLAYPDKGNAFITAPAAAGHISSGMVMNDKGFAGVLAGGQHSRPEDKKIPAFDPVGGLLYAIQKSECLDDVKENFDFLDIWGGISMMFGDSENSCYVHEHTAAMNHIRKSGDYGEDDYLIIANHFINEEMKKAHYSEQDEDSYMRYKTEAALIKEHYGNITADTVMDILGSNKIVSEEESFKEAVPEKLELDCDTYICQNSPNMRDVLCQSCITACAIPEKKEALIRSGPADMYSSSIPGSYGTYYNIYLEEDIEKSVAKMGDTAFKIVWLAGMHLEKRQCKDLLWLEELTNAKKLIHKGLNCRYQGKTDKKDVKYLDIMSEAATCYARAQLMGRRILKQL